MKYKGPRYFLCVNFLLPFLCDSSPQAEKNILQKNHKGVQGYHGDGIFFNRRERGGIHAEEGEKLFEKCLMHEIQRALVFSLREFSPAFPL